VSYKFLGVKMFFLHFDSLNLSLSLGNPSVEGRGALNYLAVKTFFTYWLK